jgi:hypothetical protein
MNPKNQFEGFFDNPEKPLSFNGETIKPPIGACIQTLMMVCASVPDWHKQGAMRMFVCEGLHIASDQMREYKERGEDPPVTSGEAAFMMILGDLLSATTQYASDEEKKKFLSDENED